MNFEEAAFLTKSYGQSHLLRYYGELNAAEREELLASIAETDFSVLRSLGASEAKNAGRLSPADVLSAGEIAVNAQSYEKTGLEAIRKNKVAAVLLAGGQGTRLGLDAPKGTFNIGVKRKLSIFECQILNLLSVAKRAGVYPHLFIMTSNINDVQTQAFFKENANFGYPADKVHFYRQKTAPAISKDGKILLEEKYRVALVPNGNGGWYSSLVSSACGHILKDEGIEWLNVYGVDNVLQKICDPVFIGATIKSGLACSGKVVKKAYPEERVGLLCKSDGLPAIVEYYEMPEKENYEREENGELKYRFGVILNYLFNVKKLDGIGAEKLPYHFAEKKVEYIGEGKKIVPEAPNAYKPETLTVDLVKFMGSCLGFEVEREREFAPVKNRTGVDSVESARALLIKNGVEI